MYLSLRFVSRARFGTSTSLPSYPLLRFSVISLTAATVVAEANEEEEDDEDEDEDESDAARRSLSFSFSFALVFSSSFSFLRRFFFPSFLLFASSLSFFDSIRNPSTSFNFFAVTASSGKTSSSRLNHRQAIFFLPDLVFRQTAEKFTRLTKFCVTATESSRLSTAV